MRRFTLFSLLCCLMTLFALPVQAQDDCRLDVKTLQPIIRRFNPFFADHKWDAATRLEMARISGDRLLLITQDGCLRHHTQFTLIIDPQAIENRQQFWVNEVNSLLHKVYFEQPVYREFAAPFGEAFEEKFAAVGLNQRFNFPIGTRNFLCEIKYDPAKGARITVEMVTFIFLERLEVQRNGIPHDEDDGWHGREEEKP